MSGRPVYVGVLVGLFVIGSVVAGGSIAFAGQATAQGSTLVDSDITSDTTWESGSGPYRIVKSITVAEEATLTIQSGVTVEVAEDVSVTVNGHLYTAGTPGNEVVITSSKQSPSPGSWGTLNLGGPYSQVHRFEHTKIEYATNALTLTGGQRALLDSVEIAHASEAGIKGVTTDGFGPSGVVIARQSSLHDNRFGIHGADEIYRIQGTQITDNDRSGLKLTNKLDIVDVTVRDSTIAGNDIGINLESNVDQHNRGGQVSGVVLQNTTISENAGLGVRVFGDRVTNVALDRVEIRSNGGSGVQIQDTGRAGGSQPSRNLTVVDSTISDNGDRGLYIDAAYSTLEAVDVTDSTTSDNDGPGIRIEADRDLRTVAISSVASWANGGAGVSLTGTQVTAISLSSIDAFANGEDGIWVDGSTLDGIEVADSRVSLNGQAGIAVNGSGEGYPTAISDVLLAGNEVGLEVQHHAARLNQSQVEYNNVTGIRFVAGGAGPNTIATTDIYGNGQALNISEADGALIADVKNNYWGASSGPFHESINPEGEGNQITGGLDTVEFLPYAESPFGTTNERPVASFEGESRNVTAGTEVTFSAAPSSDDSQIRWYSFAFNNSSDTGLIQSPSVTRTFQYAGTYRVNLSVVDDRGVPSETDATLTIRVNPAQSSDGTTKNNNNNGGSNSGGQSGSSGTTTTETRVPGFGFGAALAALLATFVVGRRFSGR